MADILFKCFECSRHLVAETDRIGEAVECGQCKERMLVPQPDIAFQCPKCEAELAAPADLAGEAFRCTRCEEALIVPAAGTPVADAAGDDAAHDADDAAAPMPDLLFKCSACPKHLAVDAGAVGKVVNCTECGQAVLVPQPGILFQCPACEAELAAPAGLAGEAFDCPNCEAALVVPNPAAGKAGS